MNKKELNDALLEATCAKDIQMLIHKGADVNTTDRKRKETALHRAMRNTNSEIVRVLVRNGANVNKKDKFGQTALFRAIGLNDNLCTYKMLIEHGASVNAGDPSGNVPIHFAARDGNIELMNMLIRNGADINAATKDDNFTALWHASMCDRPTCVLQLLCYGAEIHDVELRNDRTGFLDCIQERLNKLKNCESIVSLHSKQVETYLYKLAFSIAYVLRRSSISSLKVFRNVRSYMTFYNIFMAPLFFSKHALRCSTVREMLYINDG